MRRLSEHYSLIRQYGLSRCLFRFRYDWKQRHGLLKRGFPAWRWEDRPLASWLRQDVRGGDFRTLQESRGGAFFFTPGKLPPVPAPWASEAIREADDLLRGRFRYFSCLTGDLGFPPDWFANPFTGQRAAANGHWCDSSEFEPGQGDIKFIWEPSRFAWAYAIVRAFALTGDDRYARCFWQLLESWMAANPPQIGPNWQCGQEISIRLLACTFALFALWNSPATTGARIESLAALLAGSAERIVGNMGYARVQMGNHAVTEATALYTVGVLFPFLYKAEEWRKLGKHVMEDEARKFNWPDGSYVQHSMNYHRLMLHNYLWSLRLAQLNGDSFSSDVRDRLAKSYRFLYQLQDGPSGQLPNYGPNDGAMILPLSGCDYLDYRAVIGAMHFLFTGRRLYDEGPWQEILVWLFGPAALDAPIERPQRTSADFLRGGYFTLRGGNSWGMVRCHSYRNRPNQADMLHLDLWWEGWNVLRDSGSFTYYDPQENWGQFFISTAAHNTVVVGGVDQMIKGPRFRWFTLVRSKFVAHEHDAGLELWQGEHYGYRRLPSRAVHRRSVLRMGEGCWLVVDDLLGRGKELLELFWQLADSDCKLSGNNVLLSSRGKEVAIRLECSAPAAEVRLVKGVDQPRRLGWQSLYYGKKAAAPAVVMSVDDTLPVRFVTLVGLGRRVLPGRFDLSGSIELEIPDEGLQVGIDLSVPGSGDWTVRRLRRGGEVAWEAGSGK